MRINAEILAYILDIKKEDANKKIVCYKERLAGNDELELDPNLIGKKADKKYTDNESCDVPGLSKYLNMDLAFAMKNIHDTFMTSPTTKGFILNYPSSKLKPNAKTGRMPGKISIPKVLRQLLSQEDKELIVRLWQDKYKTYTASNHVKFCIS